MTRSDKTYKLVVAALLCAIGIIIPMYSPISIRLEPASFTLASHVALFMAMFVSPPVAIAVSLGTTLGFFLGGFPLPIVLRAFSQIVFVTIGAFLLQKQPDIMRSRAKICTFALGVSLVHGICEVLIILPLYFGNSMGEGYYVKGFAESILGLVGIGTIVHSCVDFAIACVIWKPLCKIPQFTHLFSVKEIRFGNTVSQQVH